MNAAMPQKHVDNLRIMLDTQIYDLIVLTPGMVQRLGTLAERGKLEILTTFVQESELSAIPDETKRQQILGIKRTKVHPAAGPWGVAPWGEFPWGANGSEAGLPVQKVISTAGKHWQDALIACTASAEAEILVTEDARLSKRVAHSGIKCAVWKFRQFKQHVFELFRE